MSAKIFMFLDDVSGSATDTMHQGWIHIDTIFFEVVRIIEFRLFHEKMAPENSIPALSKIIITKPHCTASPQLFTKLNMMQHSKKLIIDVVHDKSDGMIANIAGSGSTRYESEVCFISGYKLNGTGDTETLEFTVSSLSMSYNPSMDTHELDKKSSSGYHYQRLRPL